MGLRSYLFPGAQIVEFGRIVMSLWQSKLGNGERMTPMEKRSDSESARRREPSKKRWVEPVTALLMALATLSTAWCSYQSAAWTRKSNRMMYEFNSLEHK